MRARTTKSVTEKSEKATKTAVKVASESESILVQVDEETAKLLQTIRDSISSEISENLEKLKTTASSDKSNASMEADFKIMSKRVDEIVGQLEELSDTVDTVKTEVHKMNLTLDKVAKLLKGKESKG